MQLIKDFDPFKILKAALKKGGELADIVSKAVKEGKIKKDIGLVKNESSEGFFIKTPPADVDLLKKVLLVKKGNAFARGFDKKIGQVKVVYGDGFRQMTVVNSLGQWIEESRIR